MTTKFKHNNSTYSISILYYESLVVLPEKFDIKLSKILTDGSEAEKVLSTLLLDDEAILSLMWHYIEEEYNGEWDDFIKKVQRNEVDDFREAFWAEVENFTGPLKRGMIQQIWKEFKKEIKNLDIQTKISEQSAFSSNPEESTLEDSPSEK